MHESSSAGLRSRSWTDLIVKVCLALLLGALIGRYLPRYLHHKPSDNQKWLARPKLQAEENYSSSANEHQSVPCFFLLPSGTSDEPAKSGDVADCVTLVPNGKMLDLVELNLASQLLFHVKTDLFVPDVIPLAFTRTYYPVDSWSQKFRIYLPHVYDPYLTGSRFPYTYSDWLLPDRRRIHFARISSGTGFADYVAESRSPADHVFSGSRIAWNGSGWDLALRDGTTYLSPEAYNAQRPQQGSLIGVFDSIGDEVRLDRASNGDLNQVTSPSGHSIRVEYNSAGQVTNVVGDSRRSVEYEYDSENRLCTVRYSNNQAVSYAYDGANRLIGAEDSATRTHVALEYKANRGGPSDVHLMMNSQTFDFVFHIDELDPAKRTMTGHIDIWEAQHQVVRVRLRVLGEESFWSLENRKVQP